MTYPNLFVMLVGRPGVGKSKAMSPANRALKKAEVFHVSPQDLNKATFLRWMASDECRDRVTVGDSIVEETHSGVLRLSEFGVFVKAHDLELLSCLCKLFDADDDYDNRRIYQGKDTVFIPNPIISILAGTQPGYLSALLPPEAWTQGFMGRVIMVHSGEPAKVRLFGKESKADTSLESALIHDLLEMKGMSGEYDFTEEAKDAITAWHSEGDCDGGGTFPVPSFPRLESYNTRRILHLLKLCMISAAARSNKLQITLEDFELALDWLLAAEKTMPNVFLEMAGRSDADVLREMWHYAWSQWAVKKQAMHKARLMAFLSVRVPAYAADKVLSMATEAGYFKKGAKDMYEPRPKNEWGQV